jgi:hypothetical protein
MNLFNRHPRNLIALGGIKIVLLFILERGISPVGIALATIHSLLPQRPSSWASPEAQEAGLGVRPGSAFSLFVRMRSICISLHSLVVAAAASSEIEVDGALE